MIHSQTKEKDEILDQFRQKGLDVLVCTTLLERGITVPSVQVIVCQADHAVFTSASLIQIFGRVGRSFDDPTGKGVCLCFPKKSGNQRMCRSALPNECFCLDCLRPLDEETTFTRMIF